MTAFDIIVLFLIGAGAVFGFLRGFVQEALALLAWALVIAAVRFLHAPVTGLLTGPVGTQAGSAVLSFILIGIVTYGVGRWIANSVGQRSRKSLLGPVDRVLGFGFGATKGLIGASLLFMLIVMSYEMAFGAAAEKPGWLTASRTFPLMNASAEAISTFVATRRGSDEADSGAAGPGSRREGDAGS